MTIAEFAISKPSDGTHMARRARLLAALAGMPSRTRATFGKVIGEVVRSLAKDGFTGMVRFALADTEGTRVVEAVIGAISTEPDRRATPVLDSDATRAKLELLGSRVTGFEISGWSSPTPRITLRQSLPAETRLPAQSETLHWAELLDCSSLEEAVVQAQQRGKLLAAELSYARAHQQTPAAIAARPQTATTWRLCRLL